MNKCIAYCTAKTYHFEEIRDHFLSNYKTALYRDTLHVSIDEGDIFIYPFGVAVFWNCGADRIRSVLEDLKKYHNGEHEPPIIDEFTYSVTDGGGRIREDHIILSSDEAPEKIAISHAISQSLKLSELENYAQKTIDATSHIPQNIAHTGGSRLKRREIARMRGTLFLVESEINLKFELLDTPEFFWEYPEVEPNYEMTARYLEVRPRVEILNKKLSIIRELFDMLADEQNHKHSAVLEWIIIWLIAIEIVMFFVKEFITLN
jgi:uncharacterized Rmd1/YagE family protein